MLIDCHAHLHVPAFDKDREDVIDRAFAAGIGIIINVGFDVEGNFQALTLAKKNERIFATMGVHPHLASEWNEEVAERIAKAVRAEPKIVALGEMGLDYYKNLQPRQLQLVAFREQLALAKKLELPVIVHCRDAFEDAFRILDEAKAPDVLMHCFTGTLRDARRSWERGFYTAFTGIVTYPSAEEVRACARECPENRLLIETDCPYLPPQSLRGKRNEPAHVREILQTIARARNQSSDRLEKIIEENTRRFFKLPDSIS